MSVVSLSPAAASPVQSEVPIIKAMNAVPTLPAVPLQCDECDQQALYRIGKKVFCLQHAMRDLKLTTVEFFSILNTQESCRNKH